jgi:hypothetical protein
VNWAEVREIHRRTTAGAKEGIAFRYFSRPLASFVLYFLKDGRVTPNQVTILSLAVAVLGSLVQAFHLDYAGLVIGGALFMLAHMLDALDGQLARLRQAGSVIGMHFDFFIDGVKAYLMLGALAFRLHAQSQDPGSGRMALLGDSALASPTLALDGLLSAFGPSTILILALLGMAGLATGVACTDFLKKKEWKEAFPGTGGSAPPLPVRLVVGLGRFVVDYPSYILLLSLLNRVDLYLLAYCPVVILYAARSLLAISARLWRVDPYRRS